MNSVDFIRQSMESTRAFAVGLLTDLQDSPLAQPTPHGGNHALWILSHLAYSEAQLFDQFIQGRPNRFKELAASAGIRSQPVTDSDAYPTFEEAMGMLEEVRADVLEYLSGISDEDLDAASHAPEQLRDGFGTVGKCFSAMIMHPALHAGQATVIRRSLEREPLMA